MPLTLIHDGLTIDAQTAADFGGVGGLPVVSFKFRPPLWDELLAWRQTIGTPREGPETLKLVRTHLVSWDVIGATGGAAPVDEKSLRCVPSVVLDQILAAMVNWAPKEQVALGNG